MKPVREHATSNAQTRRVTFGAVPRGLKPVVSAERDLARLKAVPFQIVNTRVKAVEL